MYSMEMSNMKSSRYSYKVYLEFNRCDSLITFQYYMQYCVVN